MPAALELAGDHESEVVQVHVALGRGMEQGPIGRVDGDHPLAERVDFACPVQLLKALGAMFRSAPHLSRIGGRIEPRGG